MDRSGSGPVGWPPSPAAGSPASQRQALIILTAMFTWLVNAGYLRGNRMWLLR
ncbi:hypothetical protein [Paraburkholderia mimosarum]|uniref:hypothetical protein n=1 Tax=Paraburkholderia mimosarum TaxID=312026 RepID=UPI000415E20A|nr:hypothetical protein [Paraburkholderia mimosarum]